MNEFQLDPASRSQRRTAISQHETQIGLDYIDVQWSSNINSGSSCELDLHFIPSTFTPPTGKPPKTTVPTLTAANIQILGQGGEPSSTLQVQGIEADKSANRMRVILKLQGAQMGRTYTLALVNVFNLDRFFSKAPFSLEIDSIREFDSVATPLPAPVSSPALEIDYLARDYGSFRQVMLNRLSVLMPQWKEHHPAGLGTVLVEVLAYAADRLSYYQDAVATEAYLGTARRRISVKRHAQLIDYRMHEGCNARAWVHIQTQADDTLSLPAGTLLATQSSGYQTVIAWEVFQALKPQVQVFETLHPVDLVQSHNQLSFYDWGLEAFYLPQGCTCATLKGSFSKLKPGDVLILEERLSPTTGYPDDANLSHRHPVRLTQVMPQGVADPLLGIESLTEIEWMTADALPFQLYVSRPLGGQIVRDISVARGNIALAEHGQRTPQESLPKMLEGQRYRPRLQNPGLTHAVPYKHTQAITHPASMAMVQDPRRAIPMINLHDGQATWWAQRDLLRSDRFANDFVVETESDGFAQLRFGDGIRGRQPQANAHLYATYRVGNGVRGNVGQEAIAHLITTGPQIPSDGSDPGDTGGELQPRSTKNISDQISLVRNPLPAQGGVDPETLDQVRLYAPQVFRAEQQRCINADDYKQVAERHSEVDQAAAVLRWTGSWYTATIAVKRQGNRPVDLAFQQTLLNFLEPFRLAGYDLEVVSPRFVPLEIVLSVKLAKGFFASTVKKSLIEAFSNAELPNGERGFFHPDHFTFGQPVYFSQLIEAVMRVPGVAGVHMPGQEPSKIKFQRWGAAAQGELEAGKIPIGILEIARLDNTASTSNSGRMLFHLEGGL